MVKKESDKNELRTYSNYIIGIVALVLSVFNPFPGLILGIVGLVRIGKQKDTLSKKAKVLNLIAIIVGIVLIVVSVVVTLAGLDLTSLTV